MAVCRLVSREQLVQVLYQQGQIITDDYTGFDLRLWPLTVLKAFWKKMCGYFAVTEKKLVEWLGDGKAEFHCTSIFIEPSYQICQTMAFWSFIFLQCDWVV